MDFVIDSSMPSIDQDPTPAICKALHFLALGEYAIKA